MTTGKLFHAYDNQLVMDVDYRLFDDSANNWWGELTLSDYKRISDGDGYFIELADGRRGRCFLTKKVNKAVSGLLPLYCYRFRGNGNLAKPASNQPTLI
jgi:hypothetical protein